MASGIIPSLPADGTPAVKAQLRANLAFAKSEIEALQAITGALPSSFAPPGRRNRVINGDMGFNQRNGVSAKASAVGTTFGPDRWYVFQALAGGVITSQSLTASPPTGFRNYVRLQTTTLKALVAADAHSYQQAIEGVNVTDFGWGAVGAKAVAISFWVRASLTGAYAVSLKGATSNATYVTSYTVNVANTWEYKTVFIPGPTIGTFTNISDTYLGVVFDLGSGTTFRGTQNVWSTSNFTSFTGAINLVSTLNATLDITGVVLEPGTIANGWENYLIQHEALACQRYYQSAYVTCRQYSTLAGSIANNSVNFAAPMRSTPTAVVVSTGAAVNATGAIIGISLIGGRFEITSAAVGDSYINDRIYTLEAEIT